MLYNPSYYETREWQETRERIIIINGGFCVFCGNRNNLNVHHLTYERFAEEYDSDLCVLCEGHHRILHEEVNSYTEWLNKELSLIDKGNLYFDAPEIGRLLVKKCRRLCRMFERMQEYNYAGVKIRISEPGQKPRMENIITKTASCFWTKNRSSYRLMTFSDVAFESLRRRGFPLFSELLRVRDPLHKKKYGRIDTVEEWNEKAKEAVKSAMESSDGIRI